MTQRCLSVIRNHASAAILFAMTMFPFATFGCDTSAATKAEAINGAAVEGRNAVEVENDETSMPASNKSAAQSTTGNWKATSASMAGTPFPESVVATVSLVLTEGGYEANVGGLIDKGTCEIDETTTPPQMRIVGTEGPNMGKTFLAIYDFPADNQLRVAYDLTGTAYPTSFDSSAENGYYVAVYAR